MSDHYISKAKEDIKQWEQDGPGWLAKVGNFILWPANKAAEMLIPNGVHDAVAKAIEGFLLGISNLSQHTVNAADITGRIAANRAAFGKHPDLWQELTVVDQEAESCWNWNLGFAATEGGAAGAAGLFGLAADIPALFTIVIRLIQQTAICYGYDPTKPEEQDYVIHILRTGSADDIKTKLEALMLLKQLEVILIKVTWKKMTAEFAAKQFSKLSLLAATRQFAKSLGINLTKRKALQMIPIIGAIVGASFNANFANDVGRTAFMSYRRRWIAERERAGNPSGKVARVSKIRKRSGQTKRRN